MRLQTHLGFRDIYFETMHSSAVQLKNFLKQLYTDISILHIYCILSIKITDLVESVECCQLSIIVQVIYIIKKTDLKLNVMLTICSPSFFIRAFH